MHLPPGVVAFGPDANCDIDTCPIEWSVYGYRPSLVANGAFVALFGLGGIIHTCLGFRWKTWWFMSCMIVSSINACIGYAARIWLRDEPFLFKPFQLQMICITTCPVYYSAAVYVTLGQTIDYFSPALSRLEPLFFHFGFVTCDIISLALQAVGGVVSTSSKGADNIGINISLAGLALQVVTTFSFSGFLLDFIIRYFRSDAGQRAALIMGIRLELFFGYILLAMFLTTVRSLYRLIELHEGYSGELVRDQPIFISLEGVLVVVSFYCLMIGHPGLIFTDTTKERLKVLEKTRRGLE